MARSEIFQEFRELIESNGDGVGLDSPVCVLWKSEHDNCKGCSAELGCAKATAMMGVSLTNLIYKPKDYEDFQRMNSDIHKRLSAILEAKSAEEVKAVNW